MDMGKLINGFLYFSHTDKNLLSNCGENVYPEEVKRQIFKNPHIESVVLNSQKTYVTGHVLHAQIGLTEHYQGDVNEIKNWIKENISEFKLPKVFTFKN